MDSFKGSLGSIEAGKAVAEGIRRADGETDVIVRPLADGGEGTVEALVSGMGGKKRRIKVIGPLGEAVDCEYGIIEETGTAVIEMAAAAGLLLVPVEKRNPLHTTTYGLGEMLKDAVKHGIRRFLVGIGGSATNDGGAGMLQALGFDQWVMRAGRMQCNFWPSERGRYGYGLADGWVDGKVCAVGEAEI